MPRTEYSFALPVGFAAVGDSTRLAHASAPAGLLPAPLTGAGTPLARAPLPSGGVPAPPAAGEALPDAARRAPGSEPAAGPVCGSAPAATGAPADWPTELPIGLRQDRERAASREALMRSGAPVRRGRVEEGALSRLSPQPPPPATTQPANAQHSSPGTDMEALCEELIARLRRELVVERERMGTPLGA